MAEARDNRTRENGNGDQPDPESAREQAERHFEKLQHGPKLSILGEPLSLRSVKAVGIFVGVFAAVLLVSWLLMGGIGMAVGAILGAVAGTWAVKAYSDRLGREQTPDPSASRGGTNRT